MTGARPGQFFTLYVDGEAAVELTGSDFLNAGGSWEVGSDGVLSFLAVAGDEVIRYRITPSPQSSVAKMVSEADARRAEAVAAAQANQQQAAEAAAASRAQAAADAEAAEAKRIADYNAAREAALAKRQADYEAAVAAKKAAAEAARNKRLLQLENMRRARQGLPPLTELP